MNIWKRVRGLSVSQVRLLLGLLAVVVISGAAVMTFSHKTIVGDFPAPNCSGNTCTETITSSDALAGNGGYGGAYGPIGSSAYASGVGQYAAGGGGLTDSPLPNGGCDGNGDHYDGNFWGLRGQTATFGTNPVWWYSPPTAVGSGRNCENQWGAGSPIDVHKSYAVQYGANNNKNNQSLYEDPAAFLDPAGGNGNSGLSAGWASNPDFTAGKTTWPNALKANNVDSRVAATSAWANGANFITCANCSSTSSGQTFVYRVTFDTLDPTQWQITNVSLRYNAQGWAAAWIDSTGAMKTDTSSNKSSVEGNETPFPCQNNGKCPIQYDDTTGNLSGPNGAGVGLEIGQGQADCNGASTRCGDLATILSNGTRHVLAIQGSAKSYACAFGSTGCNNVTNTANLAFWLQIQYTKAPPPPTVTFSKDYKAWSSGDTQGGLPVLRLGVAPPDTINFTESATFQLDPSDTARNVTYTISDPDPPCLHRTSGTNSTSGTFKLSQLTTPVTVTWNPGYTINATCPEGDGSYTNTATITWSDDRGWSGSRQSTKDYFIETAYLPWIHTQFGDVHSNNGIFVNPGSDATYVVSAGTSISGLNSSPSCLVLASTSCNAGGAYGILPWPWAQNANFFFDLQNFPGAQPLPNPVPAKLQAGFYVANNCSPGLVLPGFQIVGAVTIYTTCNSVTLTGDITIQPGTSQQTIPALGIIQGSAAINNGVCTGDMTINNNVQNLIDVVLFSTGVIHTAATQTTKQLTVRGGLMGCRIDLQNRIGTPPPPSQSNPPNPAEIYNYVGNFILNPPPGFLNLSQSGGTLQYSNEGIPQL